MLGQPVSMLIPRVVGFKLTGEIPAGATATDLVLTITELLRKHGVVGKFVEFYGEGVAAVPLANRATIGNMSPEYGSTCAIFPIDDETLRLPAADRPLRRADRAGRGLRQGAGPLARPVARAALLRVPRARPLHGRARASPARSARRTASLLAAGQGLLPRRPCATTRHRRRADGEGIATGVDEASAESFPASDSPGGRRRRPARPHRRARPHAAAVGRPRSRPTPVTTRRRARVRGRPRRGRRSPRSPRAPTRPTRR